MKLSRTSAQHTSVDKLNTQKAPESKARSEAVDKLTVASSRLGGQSLLKSVSEAPTGANAAFQIGQVFAAHPPAVASVVAGAQEVSRARAHLMSTVSPVAVEALRGRIGEPAMAVSQEAQTAFSDFVDGKVSQAVLDHAPEVLAWKSYLTQVGDESGSRVLHVNMRDLPGINGVPGLEYYGLRGLGLAHSSDDIVVVPDKAPKWVVDRLQALRRQAGLPAAATLTETQWDARREEISDNREVQEFYKNFRSKDKFNYEMQEKFENKNFCMDFLAKNDVTCPELYFQGEASQLDVSAFEAKPVVAKRVRSAGGMGVKLCKAPGDLEAFVNESGPKEEIQIQELVQGHDCSKQYFISDHGAAPITNTDQIIKGGVHHAGNLILSETMTKADNANSDKAAQLIWEQGYRGYMAVDMMKPQDGGVARVIELNLRKGGVTVPTTIASQLGAKQFVSKQVMFKDQKQMEQAFAKFAINETRKTGIVPFSICPLDDGSFKVEAVFISQSGGQDIVEKLSRSLA